MKKKHLPTRTCMACRNVRLKQNMIRIVRHPDGTVGIDETGKANGRGGYLCQHFYCWRRALRKRGVVLKYALKAELDFKTIKELKKFANQYKTETKKKSDDAKEGEKQADSANEDQKPTDSANEGQKPTDSANEGQKQADSANEGQKQADSANEGDTNKQSNNAKQAVKTEQIENKSKEQTEDKIEDKT